MAIKRWLFFFVAGLVVVVAAFLKFMFLTPANSGPLEPSGPFNVLSDSPQILPENTEAAWQIQVWYPDARDERVTSGSSMPVVFYEHGLHGKMDENATLCRELASYGMLVIALGDTNEAVETPSPDFSNDEEIISTLNSLRNLVNTRSLRIRWVANLLSYPTMSPLPELTSLADWDHLGIFGFSLGGAVALETMAEDARFSAAANLDGLLFISSENDASRFDNLKTPVFFADSAMPEFLLADFPGTEFPPANTQHVVVNSESVIRRILEQSGGFRLILHKANHDDLTDRAFTRSAWSIRNIFRSKRGPNALREYLTAYFLSMLSGSEEEILAGPVRNGDIEFTLHPGNPVAE